MFPFKHSPKAFIGHSAWGGYACSKKFEIKFLTFFYCISIILSFYAGEILKACFTRHAGDRIDIVAFCFAIVDLSVLFNLVFPAWLYHRHFG